MERSTKQFWDYRQILNGEGQYALLVLNLEQNLRSETDEVLHRLWTKAKHRVLVDGGANSVYEHRYRYPNANLICGDFDSIREEVKQFYTNQSTRIVSLPDQDDTDFTKAVTYTIEQLSIETGQHIDFIVAVWKTGGRIDQCLSCINTLYKNVERMPIFLLDLDSSLSWMLKPDCQHEILNKVDSKWCSLIPIGQSCRVTTTGFNWNLTDHVLEFGGLISSSNKFDVNSRTSTVKTDKPLLFSLQTTP